MVHILALRTYGIAYSSSDVGILSTHLLIINILSCSNVERYNDELLVHA
jgi:hypothetical protein